MNITKVQKAFSTHRFRPLIITLDMYNAILGLDFTEIIFFIRELKQSDFYDDSILTLSYALTKDGTIFHVDGVEARFDQERLLQRIRASAFMFEYTVELDTNRSGGIAFTKSVFETEVGRDFRRDGNDDPMPIGIGFYLEQNNNSPYFSLSFDGLYLNSDGGGGPAGHPSRII
jgi:hypothetical protein